MFSRSPLLLGLVGLVSLVLVSAAPRNTTVDDHDYSQITYTTADNWNHDPLQGYEIFFVNGTRSFTYVPGASASFTFTGTGVYLQGTYSNDQAMRQITLDGQDMGTFAAYSVERLPSQGTSAVFWGKGGLEDVPHTVVVSHADTGDKILVLDAWIFESDSTETQPASTNSSTAGAEPATATSTSNNASSNSMPMNSNMGIIIGVVVAVILVLLLCIAGLCLLRRRRQRKQQYQNESNKEKYLASDQSHRLSSPVYPAMYAAGAKEAPANWGSTIESTSTADITSRRSPSLPSHPFHPGGRAASDSYHENSLGLSNHPLFIPTPSGTASSGSHYPTPPDYPGAPTRFFHQQPDLPPNSEYTGQPIINAPSSPSALRRLSLSIAGIVPPVVRALSPSNKVRPASVIYERRAHNTGDLERDSPRNSYFPSASAYSPNSNPIPLSPISASTGFARQSQNLEGHNALKFDDGQSSVVGETLAPSTPSASARVNPFDDDYAFSSYTRQTRNEVAQAPSR